MQFKSGSNNFLHSFKTVRKKMKGSEKSVAGTIVLLILLCAACVSASLKGETLSAERLRGRALDDSSARSMVSIVDAQQSMLRVGTAKVRIVSTSSKDLLHTQEISNPNVNEITDARNYHPEIIMPPTPPTPILAYECENLFKVNGGTTLQEALQRCRQTTQSCHALLQDAWFQSRWFTQNPDEECSVLFDVANANIPVETVCRDCITNASSFAVFVQENSQLTPRMNVSHIPDMSSAFLGQFGFNEDISRWDVSRVTDMTSMFSETTAFNQDISQWDVSNVVNMQQMFRGADAFDQNLAPWDVSSSAIVTDMFDGTNGLSECNKRLIYESWKSKNTAFETEYSSYSDLCPEIVFDYIPIHAEEYLMNGTDTNTHGSIDFAIEACNQNKTCSGIVQAPDNLSWYPIFALPLWSPSPIDGTASAHMYVSASYLYAYFGYEHTICDATTSHCANIRAQAISQFENAYEAFQNCSHDLNCSNIGRNYENKFFTMRSASHSVLSQYLDIWTLTDAGKCCTGNAASFLADEYPNVATECAITLGERSGIRDPRKITNSACIGGITVGRVRDITCVDCPRIINDAIEQALNNSNCSYSQYVSIDWNSGRITCPPSSGCEFTSIQAWTTYDTTINQSMSLGELFVDSESLYGLQICISETDEVRERSRRYESPTVEVRTGVCGGGAVPFNSGSNCCVLSGDNALDFPVFTDPLSKCSKGHVFKCPNGPGNCRASNYTTRSLYNSDEKVFFWNDVSCSFASSQLIENVIKMESEQSDAHLQRCESRCDIMPSCGGFNYASRNSGAMCFLYSKPSAGQVSTIYRKGSLCFSKLYAPLSNSCSGNADGRGGRRLTASTYNPPAFAQMATSGLILLKLSGCNTLVKPTVQVCGGSKCSDENIGPSYMSSLFRDFLKYFENWGEGLSTLLGQLYRLGSADGHPQNSMNLVYGTCEHPQGTNVRVPISSTLEWPHDLGSVSQVLTYRRMTCDGGEVPGINYGVCYEPMAGASGGVPTYEVPTEQQGCVYEAVGGGGRGDNQANLYETNDNEVDTSSSRTDYTFPEVEEVEINLCMVGKHADRRTPLLAALLENHLNSLQTLIADDLINAKLNLPVKINVFPAGTHVLPSEILFPDDLPQPHYLQVPESRSGTWYASSNITWGLNPSLFVSSVISSRAEVYASNSEVIVGYQFPDAVHVDAHLIPMVMALDLNGNLFADIELPYETAIEDIGFVHNAQRPVLRIDGKIEGGMSAISPTTMMNELDLDMSKALKDALSKASYFLPLRPERKHFYIYIFTNESYFDTNQILTAMAAEAAPIEFREYANDMYRYRRLIVNEVQSGNVCGAWRVLAAHDGTAGRIVGWSENRNRSPALDSFCARWDSIAARVKWKDYDIFQPHHLLLSRRARDDPKKPHDRVYFQDYDASNWTTVVHPALAYSIFYRYLDEYEPYDVSESASGCKTSDLVVVLDPDTINWDVLQHNFIFPNNFEGLHFNAGVLYRTSHAIPGTCGANIINARHSITLRQRWLPTEHCDASSGCIDSVENDSIEANTLVRDFLMQYMTSDSPIRRIASKLPHTLQDFKRRFSFRYKRIMQEEEYRKATINLYYNRRTTIKRVEGNREVNHIMTMMASDLYGTYVLYASHDIYEPQQCCEGGPVASGGNQGSEEDDDGDSGGASDGANCYASIPDDG